MVDELGATIVFHQRLSNRWDHRCFSLIESMK